MPTLSARFALFSQKFGFAEGVTDEIAYQHLMNVNGTGFNQTGTASLDNMSNRVWRWARDGENGVFTSQNSDNSDGVDHMITFRIDFPARRAAAAETRRRICCSSKTNASTRARTSTSTTWSLRSSAQACRLRSRRRLGLLAVGSLLSLRRNRRRP